jgi:GNAT superfamily N-acetyltransferase
MPSTYSPRALRALGAFGLTTDDAKTESRDRAERAARHARAIDRALCPGQLALIVGPSGIGKSSILSVLASRAIVYDRPSPTHRRVIDALAPTPDSVPGALHTLGAAGLADAFIPTRHIDALSAGELARFDLARAMHRAETAAGAGPGRPITLILDDLADALDDATAAGVCITLRRWLARQPRVRIIAATVRSGVERVLRPDLLLSLGAHDRPDAPVLRAVPTPAREPTLRISRGTFADYERLAHFHYRAGRPATIAGILTARLAEPGNPGSEPIAVLVASMPTLNGAWRSLAWPGDYDPGRLDPRAGRARGKRDIARRINRDIRCISRLIVHPLHRARGLGAALVRAYLADPLTRRTEAVSAMGAASPVFARAGMREWLPDPALRDRRLLDALSAADLRPWMLADIDLAQERIEQFPHLERSLRVWANAHGPTRPLAGAPTRDLIRAAARHIIAPRRAYTDG